MSQQPGHHSQYPGGPAYPESGPPRQYPADPAEEWYGADRYDTGEPAVPDWRSGRQAADPPTQAGGGAGSWQPDRFGGQPGGDEGPAGWPTARHGSDRPGTGQSRFDRSGFDQSGAGRPGADRSGSDRAGFDRSGLDRRGSRRAGGDRRDADRPDPGRFGFDRSGADRSGRGDPGGRIGDDRPGGGDRPGGEPAGFGLEPDDDRPTAMIPAVAAGAPRAGRRAGGGAASADAGDPGQKGDDRPAGSGEARNTYAVVAFVSGVIGLIPVSVVAAIVAFSQIKKRSTGGRKLVLGGLAFSAAWLLIIVVGVAIAVTGGSDPGDAGKGEDGSRVSSFELAPGDCVNELKEGKGISTVPAVPCARPHEGEVFALFELTARSWPGDAAVATQAEDGCVARLAEYAPKAATDTKLEIFFLHPTETSWNQQKDREVTCVAVDPAKRTGSLRG